MKITNNMNLPQALVNAVSVERHNKPGEISATTLIKGCKEFLLTDRHWDEMTDDAANRIWSVFGTAVHALFEHQKDNTFHEEQLKVPMEKWTVTGTIDSYDLEQGIVVDWKTTSIWKAVYKDFDDYKRQGLIYAWLLKKNGLPCHKCRFVLFLKDHSYTKSLTDSSYPQAPSFVYEFDVTPEMIEETEQFIKLKLEALEEFKNLPDDEIPPCAPVERWAEPTTWAVMKPGRKSAIRVLNDRNLAESFLATQPTKDKCYVEERIGTDKKCNKRYCLAAPFCNHYKMTHKEETEN